MKQLNKLNKIIKDYDEWLHNELIPQYQAVIKEYMLEQFGKIWERIIVATNKEKYGQYEKPEPLTPSEQNLLASMINQDNSLATQYMLLIGDMKTRILDYFNSFLKKIYEKASVELVRVYNENTDKQVKFNLDFTKKELREIDKVRNIQGLRYKEVPEIKNFVFPIISKIRGLIVYSFNTQPTLTKAKAEINNQFKIFRNRLVSNILDIFKDFALSVCALSQVNINNFEVKIK